MYPTPPYDEEFPKQISSLLGSFRGVFVCAARGRVRHNKIAARIHAGSGRDREVTCSHANDNAVEHSGLVSTIGERPRISTCARPSKCTYLRTLRHPAALSLAFPRTTKDTVRLCDLEWTSNVCSFHFCDRARVVRLK